MRYLQGLVIVDWSPLGFTAYLRCPADAQRYLKRHGVFLEENAKTNDHAMGFGHTEAAALANLLVTLQLPGG